MGWTQKKKEVQQWNRLLTEMKEEGQHSFYYKIDFEKITNLINGKAIILRFVVENGEFEYFEVTRPIFVYGILTYQNLISKYII